MTYSFRHSGGDPLNTRIDGNNNVSDMLAFAAINLTDAPTLVSRVFGRVSFIRKLPHPFEHVSITHTGIVFDNRLLRWATAEDISPCCLRTAEAYDYHFNHYVDTVTLYPSVINPMKMSAMQVENGVTVPIHRLVAGAYVPNPKRLKHVIFVNDIISDYHFQNLLWGDENGSI